MCKNYDFVPLQLPSHGVTRVTIMDYVTVMNGSVTNRDTPVERLKYLRNVLELLKMHSNKNA